MATQKQYAVYTRYGLSRWGRASTHETEEEANAEISRLQESYQAQVKRGVRRESAIPQFKVQAVYKKEAPEPEMVTRYYIGYGDAPERCIVDAQKLASKGPNDRIKTYRAHDDGTSYGSADMRYARALYETELDAWRVVLERAENSVKRCEYDLQRAKQEREKAQATVTCLEGSANEKS